MSHPAAFVPSADAARSLREIAAELRLLNSGINDGTSPGGEREIIVRDDGITDAERAFPARLELDGTYVYIPALIFDFHDWFYTAEQILSGVPTSGTWWLRAVLTANATTASAIIGSSEPVTVTASGVTFAWTEQEDATPPYETGAVPGVDYDYYFYLVKVTDGVITDRSQGTFFVRQPVPTPT